VNSEELEVSLRAEFESYLKGVLAEMRQDVSKFQKNFETEFEKHKSQMDEAFRSLAARFESENEFDQAFTQSVVEHLRLARDEGATITATAFGEAEKLQEESAPAPKFDELRDAINEITGKTSQSEILKSLVEQASNFTSRGAFFIVKNERIIGWKAFGREAAVDEAVVRNLQFPITADTLLTHAISLLKTTDNSDGGRPDDSLFLDPLEFAKPDRMYAIPLTARGRGVAVLYADYGNEGIALNVEALETLVRVAGLTVELLAASQAATSQSSEASTAGKVTAEPENEAAKIDYSQVTDVEAVSDYKRFDAETSAEPSVSEVSGDTETHRADEEYAGAVSFEEPERKEPVRAEDVEKDFSADESAISREPYSEAANASESSEVEDAGYFEPIPEAEAVETGFAESTTQSAFPAVDPFDAVAAEPVENFPPQAEVSNGNGKTAMPVAEPMVETASAQPGRTRYSDRQVDLPIEVPDDERRLHTDARRFARLLVSEIKLYNEEQVTAGRESGNLYDRLREAIDRSRDMYNKRVQPPVSATFDYFHYELVNSLAEGDDGKLGESYPGTEV